MTLDTRVGGETGSLFRAWEKQVTSGAENELLAQDTPCWKDKLSHLQPPRRAAGTSPGQPSAWRANLRISPGGSGSGRVSGSRSRQPRRGLW